jgi:hypothetical protein
METEATLDHNLHVMKTDPPVIKGALEEQFGEGYFGRVYRTSIGVFLVVAAMLSGCGGLPAVVGFAYGAALSLASLRLIEMGVRYLLHPGMSLNRARISMLMVLKLPVLALVLSGAAWLVTHHLANVFALVGGLALTQAVIVLKTVGASLVAAVSPEPRATEAARARRTKTTPAHRERPTAGARPAGVPAKHGPAVVLPAAD